MTDIREPRDQGHIGALPHPNSSEVSVQRWHWLKGDVVSWQSNNEKVHMIVHTMQGESEVDSLKVKTASVT
jgi:hypothetical protein